MWEKRLIEFMSDNFDMSDIERISDAGHHLFAYTMQVYYLTDRSGEGGPEGWNVSLREIWDAAKKIMYDQDQQYANKIAGIAADTPAEIERYRKQLDDETMKEAYESDE